MDGGRRNLPPSASRGFGPKGFNKGHHSKRRSDASVDKNSDATNVTSTSGGANSSRKSYQQERRQLKKAFANGPSDDASKSASKDSGPRVLLLRNNTASGTSASASPSRSQSPVALSQGDKNQNASAEPSNDVTTLANTNGNNWIQMSSVTGKLYKLLNGKSWAFSDDISSLFSSVGTHFKVVSAFGFQASGKSTALNIIAGKKIFPVHESESPNRNTRPCPLLQNVTSGIDMVITSERLLLLDSQPLLSASILDQMIESSTSPNAVDVNEVDAVFHTSLQLLSFLLYASDCLILTSEATIDASLIHLMHDAVSRIGVSKQLNIIWYFNKPISYNLNVLSSSLDCIFGRGIVTVINGEPSKLLDYVLRLNTGREAIEASSKVSEKTWYNSAQRFWDSLVKKNNSDFNVRNSQTMRIPSDGRAHTAPSAHSVFPYSA